MAAAPDNTPKKRGFFARLFSGRADMGEKYNVRVSFTRIFDERNRECMRWLWGVSEGFRPQILVLMVILCTLTFIGVRIALISKDMLDAVQFQELDRFVNAAILLVAVTIFVQIATIISKYL